MSTPNPADVAKMLETMKAAALSSCNFTPGVVGTGKPLTVTTEPKIQEKPKMRAGPSLAQRKAKVSDIF
jgi:hypothetical protein